MMSGAIGTSLWWIASATARAGMLLSHTRGQLSTRCGRSISPNAATPSEQVVIVPTDIAAERLGARLTWVLPWPRSLPGRPRLAGDKSPYAGWESFTPSHI